MIHPTTETELADWVRGQQDPIRLIGGGTRGVVENANLSVSDLTGVELYEPGALTLVVKAGTPLAEVEQVLAAEGQRLPFEPMDHRTILGTTGLPTIGGIAAANISGPRRIQVGACRDFMLGVRFVDGAGRVIKNGGRVMKNVTGYDVVKLMAGSFGTLGILTELSFKVLARPETEATLIKAVQNADQAVVIMSRALGSPYDVSGAAHCGGIVRIRIEGLEGSVKYRADQLKNHLGGDWDIAQNSAALWHEVRDVMPFVAQQGAIWRLSVKPSDGPKVVAALAQYDPQVIYDWGGGLVWLCIEPSAATDIRTTVAQYGGHATQSKGPREVAMFMPEPLALAALTQGIRQKFDPKGILNPEVMR